MLGEPVRLGLPDYKTWQMWTARPTLLDHAQDEYANMIASIIHLDSFCFVADTKNLGVNLETDLSFSSHVKAVTKSTYFHLKNIVRIRCFDSSQDLEKLVNAFIKSRDDYCNGLLTGLPKETIRQLQLSFER